MADVSDSQIAGTYMEIRKKDGDTNWMLLSYKDNKTITFQSSGSGGVSELASNMVNSECYYAYLKFVVKEEQTTRTKFVLLTFKGDDAPVMKKGKMSVHISNVKSVLKDFSVEYSAAHVDEVTEDQILKKVKAANY